MIATNLILITCFSICIAVDLNLNKHPEVYILIIPGFGIISTTISASSNKNVFGQDGPLNKKYLTQQTIRRELIYYNNIIQTTFLCTLKIIINNLKVNLKNVTMFVKNFYIFTNNPPITKAPNLVNLNLKSKTLKSKGLSMWVGISEAIRLFSTCSNINKLKNNKFNEWLAGIIDGDGCFQVSKKGYTSLEIVMETRDKHCLFIVKQKFGGSIKIKSDINWVRYRLHHKEGILLLVKAINGLIRNPQRILQLGKICEKYDIQLKYPEGLTYDNAWFSGFFDSDGSIYLNLYSKQVFITASQKNKFILDSLVPLYGGVIYPMVKQGAFKWTVFRRGEITKLHTYFEKNPARSAKMKRINLLKKYYDLKKLKAHVASSTSILGKSWTNFIQSWENYK